MKNIQIIILSSGIALIVWISSWYIIHIFSAKKPLLDQPMPPIEFFCEGNKDCIKEFEWKNGIKREFSVQKKEGFLENMGRNKEEHFVIINEQIANMLLLAQKNKLISWEKLNEYQKAFWSLKIRHDDIIKKVVSYSIETGIEINEDNENAYIEERIKEIQEINQEIKETIENFKKDINSIEK